MFETIEMSRNNNSLIQALKNRNTLIHEGVLLPFGHEDYTEQAHENLKVVSNLIRLYLLKLMNYKGQYFLYEDTLDLLRK